MKKLLLAFVVLSFIIGYLFADIKMKRIPNHEGIPLKNEKFSPLFKHISDYSSNGMAKNVWTTSDKIYTFKKLNTNIIQSPLQETEEPDCPYTQGWWCPFTEEPGCQTTFETGCSMGIDCMPTQQMYCTDGIDCQTYQYYCTLGSECTPTYEDCTMDFACTLAYGCEPPDAPYNPFPVDGATEVPPSGYLTWDFGWESYYYDLWLGDEGNLVQVISFEPCSPGSQGIYAYSDLISGILYQWEVVVYNMNGDSNGGSWSFTTQVTPDLNIKVFLEGPFNIGSGEMQTNLNPSDLPLSQPFTIAPWNYDGNESVIIIPNPEIVDWILVEIRKTSGDASTATKDSTILRQAAFLLKNGTIVGLDGYSFPSLNFDYQGNLFLVLSHRNHLSIMTAYPLIETGGFYAFDFTTGVDKVYGGFLGYKQIEPSICAMVAGDANSDGIINENDKSMNWLMQAGLSGYLYSDFNMEGQVDNIDKNEFWRINFSMSTQLPQ